ALPNEVKDVSKESCGARHVTERPECVTLHDARQPVQWRPAAQKVARVLPIAHDSGTIAKVTMRTISSVSRILKRGRGSSIERNWSCLCEGHLSRSTRFHQSHREPT